jgi:hypothetical protein
MKEGSSSFPPKTSNTILLSLKAEGHFIFKYEKTIHREITAVY